MRKIVLSLNFLLIYLVSYGQQEVQWKASYNSEESAVEFSASIKEGWHIYSQSINLDAGPVPTSFDFDTNESYKLVGKVIEPESIVEYDENFGGELAYFKDEVTFTQKIKLKSPTNIKGSMTYMLCNDTRCLPPRDDFFEIKLKNKE